MCAMMLVIQCDILLLECIASSLSLDNIFSIFVESVVISAFTQGFGWRSMDYQL